jgi:hypothetical protein
MFFTPALLLLAALRGPRSTANGLRLCLSHDVARCRAWYQNNNYQIAGGISLSLIGIIQRFFEFFGSRRSALAVLEFTNACIACVILVRRSPTGRPGRGYFQIVERFSKRSSLW